MVTITMKDALVNEAVDESMHDVLTSLNNCGQKGLSFMVMDRPDGTKVGFNIDNILTFGEHDE